MVGTVPPIELVWERYLVATIALMAFNLIKHQPWHWDKRNGALTIWAGLIGNTLSIVTQETGTLHASAQAASVITAATPTFMVIFAWLLLKERLTKVKLLSLTLATLGVLAIVGVNVQGSGLGMLLLVIAALMSVLVKLINPHYSVLQVTTIDADIAVGCLTPHVLSHWATTFGHYRLISLSIGGSFLYLGLISTALAFVLWNRGVQMLNAATSGLYFLFQPVVGSLLGWLCLGEQITWSFLLGLVLVATSIWVSIRFAD